MTKSKSLASSTVVPSVFVMNLVNGAQLFEFYFSYAFSFDSYIIPY